MSLFIFIFIYANLKITVATASQPLHKRDALLSLAATVAPRLQKSFATAGAYLNSQVTALAEDESPPDEIKVIRAVNCVQVAEFFVKNRL
ncbi:hypothetical protein CEXT_40511 [Caerostris extrusa]|uniref:Uncharacterized protein n=1 Tax=Caerostris extrusa TaxID=172846 RepID=A0AAV4Y7N0_CAEEX|nr:hypothetical protein CEXT_40511 [Caerostris extrusa]